MRYYLLLLLLGTMLSCKNEKDVSVAISDSALIESFKYSPQDKPLISVHRGGKGIKNYPENCLETLKYINSNIYGIYEVDVAQTKDGQLVLMHDNSLERTTTGTDRLTKYTFSELKEFNLVDDFGNETPFKIPLFKDVLNWATSNNAVLTIDIKRSGSVEKVIELIRETEAEDISIIITYNVDAAKKAYQLAPDLLLSVSARNVEEFNWLLESGIPTKNMVAFTGTLLSPNQLYKSIHKKGIKTILGTLGNLDKQAQVRGNNLYKDWVNRGIDIIATDRPFQVAKALQLEKK